MPYFFKVSICRASQDPFIATRNFNLSERAWDEIAFLTLFKSIRDVFHPWNWQLQNFLIQVVLLRHPDSIHTQSFGFEENCFHRLITFKTVSTFFSHVNNLVFFCVSKFNRLNWSLGTALRSWLRFATSKIVSLERVTSVLMARNLSLLVRTYPLFYWSIHLRLEATSKIFYSHILKFFMGN